MALSHNRHIRVDTVDYKRQCLAAPTSHGRLGSSQLPQAAQVPEETQESLSSCCSCDCPALVVRWRWSLGLRAAIPSRGGAASTAPAINSACCWDLEERHAIATLILWWSWALGATATWGCAIGGICEDHCRTGALSSALVWLRSLQPMLEGGGA